jgi:hypothetical protein
MRLKGISFGKNLLITEYFGFYEYDLYDDDMLNLLSILFDRNILII